MKDTANNLKYRVVENMPSKAPPGHFTVLYFASAASFTKKESEHLKAPVEAAKLFDTLDKQYPGMKAKVLTSCAVTVNLDYVDLEDADMSLTIKEGDEVGIIPPVSSG